MGYDSVFLRRAEEDLLEAYILFDERNRGEDFYRAIDVALSLVRTFPMMAPIIYNGYRRKLLEKFPYGIFYKIHGDRLVITAIMDLRQKPETIFKRLK